MKVDKCFTCKVPLELKIPACGQCEKCGKVEAKGFASLSVVPEIGEVPETIFFNRSK